MRPTYRVRTYRVRWESEFFFASYFFPGEREQAIAEFVRRKMLGQSPVLEIRDPNGSSAKHKNKNWKPISIGDI